MLFALTSDALYYTLSLNGVDARLFRIDDTSGSTTELTLPFKAGSAYISSKGPRFPDLWVTIAGWSSNYKRYRYHQEPNSFSVETISSPASYPRIPGTLRLKKSWYLHMMACWFRFRWFITTDSKRTGKTRFFSTGMVLMGNH